LQEYATSRDRYRQPQTDDKPLIPQGIEGLVPYRGSLKDVLLQYLGGLRQGMGYVGASTIDDLREKADFIFYTTAGQNESHPHGVKITKEAPNYPG
jgi:IMP dehydrogenase